MAVRATGINPAMLRWAREQAGYSVERAAGQLKKAPAELHAWEMGDAFPTWRQFERLAREVYHRPTALFFLPYPPEEDAPIAEFRRLPQSKLDDLEPDTWLAIRQAKARQLDLAELADYDAPDTGQIIRDLGSEVNPDYADELAAETRRYLGIAPDDQLKWTSNNVALDNWRDAVQASGVWVFKRSFRQHDVAGFCLADARYPLVYLNNGQPKVRQIFTLFHELAHLLFEFSHLERTNVEHYVGSLQGHDREIEIACNRFAGEFLVPTSHFRQSTSSISGEEPTEAILVDLAQKYRVSREVVLRKYLDQGWIDRQFYHEKVAYWRNQPSSAVSQGGDYYANQGTYLGVKYLSLAFRGYYQGAYDIDQLAEYMDIKASNVDGLANWLNRRLSPR